MEWFWTELLERWWGKLIISLILFLIVWAIFHAFARYETGETVRVPWYMAWAFPNGKWFLVAPFALAGAVFAWAGIQQFRDPEE